jgi:hypothetical protein
MEKFYTPQTSKELQQTSSHFTDKTLHYIIALEGFGCPDFTKHVHAVSLQVSG